jgi:Tfp pilus assembly protein PilX|tara:strand:- start:359 stop:562 length:204 start_codon:yes stop_codon:yes gene_type:complete
MKTYKIQVWHDYQVTDTYEVEVQASSEEEAMQLAEEAVRNGDCELWNEGERMEHSFEANENSIEELD